MKTTHILAVCTLGVLTTLVPAQQMSYQGRITDSTGAAVQDNQATIQFSIWDDSTNGVEVWGPVTLVVDLIDSRFSVKLGPNDSVSPPRSLADSFTGSDSRFIQVAIEGQEPLPRQEILATPSSFSANSASTLASAGEIAASANGPRLDAPNQVLVGRDTALGPLSSLNIKHPDSSASADPNGGIRLIEDDSTNAWQMFYDTSSDNLAFNFSFSTESSPIASLSSDGNFNTGGNITTGGSFLGSDIDIANGALQVGTTNRTVGIGREYNNVALNARSSDPAVNVLLNLEQGDARHRFRVLRDGSVIIREIETSNSNTTPLSMIAETPGGVHAWNWTIDSNQPNDADLLLHYNGTLSAICEPNSDGWRAASDATLKEDIKPLQNSLERVNSLRPLTYNYKADPNKRACMGFLAQEVQEVLPDHVTEAEGLLTLNYGEFGVLAVGAVQELKAELDAETAKNKALQDRLATLEEQLNTLVTTVETLQPASQ